MAEHHDHTHAWVETIDHGDGHQHGAEDGGPAAAPLRSYLAALLVLGLGLYFVYLLLSGNFGNYVNVRFGWLPLLSAVLCLVLGANALLVAGRKRQAEGPTAPAPVQPAAAHVHRPLSWRGLGIVAVPLALGVLVPSQPLGAAAVGGDLSLAGDPGDSVIMASDSLEWTVLDWLRAFSYGGSPDRLNGKPADVTGFVYRREGDPSDHFVVARFLMAHCAADAYAVGVPVAWRGGEALPVDTWVRVRGTVRIGPFRANALPIIEAISVDDRSERPKQTYLYP